MEYTKEQRHEIYKRALERVEARGCCLCYAISNAVNNTLNDFHMSWNKPQTLEPFEEILLFKPEIEEGTGGAWWDNNDYGPRLSALEFCIEMTRP